MRLGVQSGLAMVAVVGGPPTNGPHVDAEEAGDFGLGVAFPDARDGEAATVFQFSC